MIVNYDCCSDVEVAQGGGLAVNVVLLEVKWVFVAAIGYLMAGKCSVHGGRRDASLAED